MAASMRRKALSKLLCLKPGEPWCKSQNSGLYSNIRINNIRLLSSGIEINPKYKRYLKLSALALGFGFVAGASADTLRYFFPRKLTSREDVQPTKFVQNNVNDDGLGLNLTLFQFVTCPFCCKVRAMLDYYGINYNIVEVNSVTRKETKWTDYSKVPILVSDGVGSKGYIQMNDSSLILSILESYICDKSVSLEKFMTFYPALISETKRKKKKYDYPNRYFVMYQEKIDDGRTPEERKEERTWRKWVDDHFVHVISPNVYRTLSESYQTFQWFSKAGDWEKVFDDWSRLLVIYSGAFVMYFVGKSLKRRYNLRYDVRESLYDHCNAFMDKGLKGRDFVGGKQPNLADLSMYGILTSIEGTEAFKDMLEHCEIGPWFYRTKEAVTNHAGASKLVQK